MAIYNSYDLKCDVILRISQGLINIVFWPYLPATSARWPVKGFKETNFRVVHLKRKTSKLLLEIFSQSRP